MRWRAAALLGGICALLLAGSPALARAETLDQHQEETYGTVNLIGPENNPSEEGLAFAQIFTDGISGSLGHVELFLNRVEGQSPAVVEITASSGGVPSGPALAEAEVPASEIPGESGGWVSVALPTRVAVSTGTQYAIVVYVKGDSFDEWHTGTGDYSRGQLCGDIHSPPNGAWVCPSYGDHDELIEAAFRTYVEPSPPSIQITSPREGATYAVGERVIAEFSCTEEGSSELKPGKEGCEGVEAVTYERGARGARLATGTPLNTEEAGAGTLTVIARSKDGATAEKTVSYRVAGPPSITLTTPGEDATYTQHEPVPAEYSCEDSHYGPGLVEGKEGCAGTVAKGVDIETSTLGEHKFKVIAKSKDGQKAEKIVTYFVELPKCSMISGSATFKKSGAPSPLELQDSLSTTLSSPQTLIVRQDASALDYELTELEGATCETTTQGHVFSGHGLAEKGNEQGWAISFAFTEAAGQFTYKATLSHKTKKTETEIDTLKTSTEKIS
jgi:hypothetical protein